MAPLLPGPPGSLELHQDGRACGSWKSEEQASPRPHRSLPHALEAALVSSWLLASFLLQLWASKGPGQQGPLIRKPNLATVAQPQAKPGSGGRPHSQQSGHLATKDKVHGRLQGAPHLTPCFSHHLPHPLLALDLSAQGASIQLHPTQVLGPTPGTLSLPPRPQLHQVGLHFPNIQQTGSLRPPPGLSCKITE